MKNIYKIIFTLLLGIIFSSNVFAQGIKIGVGGGLTMVQSPDAITNEVNNGGFGFNDEWHIGLKGKIDLPLVPLEPIFFVQYHSLSGEGSGLLGLNDVSTSMSIVSVGAGGQFGFIPGPLSPYLGLDVSYNNFSEIEVESSTGTQTFNGSRSRFGLGIAIGAEFTLLPLIDVDASVKYNWFNIVGNEDGEETVGAIIINANILFSAI